MQIQSSYYFHGILNDNAFLKWTTSKVFLYFLGCQEIVVTWNKLSTIQGFSWDSIKLQSD